MGIATWNDVVVTDIATINDAHPSAIEWNGIGLDAYENLTTYTEVDQNNDITLTVPKCDVSGMNQGAQSYVYFDFGVGNIGNFSIDMEIEITAGANSSAAGFVGASNTIGTLADHDTANDGIIANFHHGARITYYVNDFENSALDSYDTGSGAPDPIRYMRFARVGTATTLKIYSDSARTALVDTISITSVATTYRYFYVLCNNGNADNSVTYYSQNYAISGF